MKEIISGAELKAMLISAAANIENHKQPINDLNVFPVPDGDTGTNMALTLSSAAKELKKASDDITVGKCAGIAASALLRGARGNSGVITSLLFRGFSKSLKDKTTADGMDLAAALTEGVEAAYKAVMKPAEGTILTVSRVSAEAATEACAETTAIEAILDVAIASAGAALEETVNQNPVLKKAGVVDAGGKGYLMVLEAMKAAMLGDPVELDENAGEAEEQVVEVDMSNFTFTYDTVYIVRKGENCDLEAYAQYLNSIGDSLVIGEDDEIFKVHVHTDIPGAALTEAAKYGTLELAKIENMRTQCEDQAAGRKAISTDDLDAVEEELENAEEWKPGQTGRKIAEPEKRYGVVSVCAGEGLAAMFRDLGVDQIVSGGQTMNPSTEDILKMIDATPAEVVMVLPNNKNIFMAAEQCKPLSEKEVVVIPTATVPQGITAMLNMDPSASVEENVENMTSAIEGVRTMQITYAARNSDFDGFEITEGDYLALDGKALFGTDKDISVLLRGLAESAKGSEFITIFYGEDISEEEATQAEKIFAEVCGNAEVTLVYGGQPVYYYLISAE